jgi:aminoglycoside phosphotransferase family enzyme/predicted kinase
VQPAVEVVDPSSALRQHEALIDGLMRPDAYPEPIDTVQRIDTHVSTVLLAGDYAYKLRKPVNLGFLDFSTLELRRRDCEEELRLNQRTAPRIYLDVVAITGNRTAPRVVPLTSAGSEPLEYAVRMRRFDPHCTLDHLAERAELTPSLVDRLAVAVAELHSCADVAGEGHGTPQRVEHWIEDNFAQLRDHVRSAADRARLDALAQWSNSELKAQHRRLADRRRAGFIRECHGDLHLGNIVLLDDVPTLFDAIEFNSDLRCIDVISDVAFTFMDLVDHGLAQHAWRFVSAYLEITGDYDGLALLRLYAVYRALVRAKVALIRLNQPEVKHQVRLREHASFERYLALAERLQGQGVPVLAVMTGVSGSGKSTVARVLAAGLGGVRIRSDVERKRLHGLPSAADSRGGIYSDDATRRTYDRLAALAETVLRAGVPAVIDAASLKRAERQRFLETARRRQVPAAIVLCTAPLAILRERVRARALAATDPSEATEAVLEQQCSWQEPLSAEQRRLSTVIDTSEDIASIECRAAEIAASLVRKAAGAS